VAEVWRRAGLVVKVKEPLEPEFARIRSDLILFTYLHLAGLPEVTRALVDSGCVAIAYETVQLPDGTLPLLIPMSQIAGRMAPELASQWLRKPGPGRGKLFSGLPGAPQARVVILGAGTVAQSAGAVAVALGAHVTIIGKGLEHLRAVDDRWPGRVTTLISTPHAVSRSLEGADVLISAVLIVGERAPKLVRRDQLRSMGEGAVAIAVDIDQGGGIETARATTHDEPIFVEEGVVHYCVPNMPGAVPHTSTAALTAATLPYLLRLAGGGLDAVKADRALLAGVNVARGQLTNAGVASSFGRNFAAAETML
jgi:alanine dehydrogenase